MAATECATGENTSNSIVIRNLGAVLGSLSRRIDGDLTRMSRDLPVTKKFANSISRAWI